MGKIPVVPRSPRVLLTAAGLLTASLPLTAQDNYEIQVYGSETMAPGRTMVELHSNYTLTGPRDAEEDGVRTSVHTWHETIEITHGFTPQLRRPHRPHPQHRPPDRQADPGPPLRGGPQ